MDHNTPGLPAHHQLWEFTQTHVHWVSDAIQPSHPLSSPSPPTFNLSRHQALFKWVNSSSGGQSIRVSASASVLPMNIQDWFPLGWTGWISLQSKGLSRVFSNTTVQKQRFFGAQPSLWSHTPHLQSPCLPFGNRRFVFCVYESASVLYMESLVLFFRFHVCGITYHLSFSAWLTWLSMIFSRSTHVAVNGTGVGLPKAREWTLVWH